MSQAPNVFLDAWNQEEPSAARDSLLPCNGSRRWAERMVQARPFASPETLFQTADTLWSSLSEEDWQEAFDSHPRLGEKVARTATARSLTWSEAEQSRLATDTDLQRALADANRAYEARFGRIFLLCAAGKGTQEVLASLRSRLGNDPATELQVAAEQQRRITQLRLRKWLGLPAVSCDAV